jgi:hypothetical protein
VSSSANECRTGAETVGTEPPRFWFSVQKKTEENMYIGLGGLLILILILWLLGVI